MPTRCQSPANRPLHRPENETQREHGRVVITKYGRPAAVVLSIDDLESLEETLDVMDNASLVADIREALIELDATPATVLSKDEALRIVVNR